MGSYDRSSYMFNEGMVFHFKLMGKFYLNVGRKEFPALFLTMDSRTRNLPPALSPPRNIDFLMSKLHPYYYLVLP